MSNSKRGTIEKKIATLIRRFKVEDIKLYILPKLDIPWKKLEDEIFRCNLAFSSLDISKLLIHMLKNKAYEDLSVIYNNILLIDIMQYNERRHWTTIIMKHERNILPPETQWLKSVVRSFRKRAMNAHVYSLLKNELRWFVIVVNTRTRNKGIISKSPVFLAVSLNSPYAFYSPKTVQSDLLKIVVDGLGYDDHRLCNLNGKSIASLLLMLERKKNACKIRQALPPPDNHVDIIRSSDGYNFVQDKDSLKYVSNLTDNIVLDSYTINVQSEWRGLSLLPELEGTEFNTKLTIRSANVAETIKDLVKSKAITQPFPPWVQEFSLRGRNAISIGKREP